jgi:RNA polymerase sigma-70 factor (ECF subfamily)
MEIQSLRTDDCIDEVIELYSGMVYRLALSHMKTRHDAEDVFQDVFLRYISKPRAFESEEHRKAWLIRVTVNRCRSLWAAWFRKTVPFDETTAPDTGYETEEESGLREYLELIPRKYRLVIHLFYYEDMTVRQIGEIMDAKESTVRTWLTRARNMLGEQMRGGSLNGQECV